MRVSYRFISCYFQFKSYLKQLYISHKTEHFSYKNGCGVCVLGYLKEELTLAIDKWFQFISNIMLLETVIPLRN